MCYNYPDFGVWGLNLGYFACGCKTDPDFFGSPDHVLQEKHLLQSPRGEGMPTDSFWSMHITVSMPFCTGVFIAMQVGVDRWQVDVQCLKL